jgi:hypothetical protein
MPRPSSRIVEPDGDPSLAGLLQAIGDSRLAFEARLLQHGTLLFRGWHIANSDALLHVVDIFSQGAALFRYAGGASPRTSLGGGSYSSTEYPEHLQLALHNELSYAAIYPTRLYFHCLVEPRQGGETTIGDSRRILARIDHALLDRLRHDGIRYVRNLSSAKGSGYAWQDAFETDDPADVEHWARSNGADIEWRGDVVRLSQVLPATMRHPQTGEEVWFNQADGFHPTALGPLDYAEALALRGSEDHFRLNCTHGNGEPFAPDTLRQIREAISAETIGHRWRLGDLLVIDNLLSAHGRMPFSGPRKIALAMT